MVETKPIQRTAIIKCPFFCLVCVYARYPCHKIMTGNKYAIKPKIPIIISFIGVILQLILCYLLIPEYGIVGAAISTSLTSLCLMLIGILALKKYFSSFMKLSSVLRIIFVSSIIFLIVIFLNSFHLNKYYIFLFSPFIISIYFGLLYLIGEIKKKEIDKVTNKLKSLKINI